MKHLKRNMSLMISAGLAVGLAACNSTNTNWTRPDDSPWSSKHAALAEAAPADDIIYEPISLDDLTPPVLPEPVAMDVDPVLPEQELAAVTLPEPAMVTPAALDAGGADSAEDIVLSMPKEAFAVQVYASSNMDNTNRYQETTGLDDLKVVKTERGDAIYYVLVGLYRDRLAAREAAVDLEARTGSKPWVRSMNGLQQIVMR